MCVLACAITEFRLRGAAVTGVSFPIDGYLPKIQESVRTKHALIIDAEPGAGKTTRVPLAIDNCVNGKVLVLEPRRLAAKLSAEHMAKELSQSVGERVGYQIRYEKALGPGTSIIFLTEGMFVRLLVDNPTFEGVGCVILDEFHERNINTDIALAIVRYLQLSTRPDMKLIVMSATLDSRSLKSYLGDCDVFSIPGRQFSVDVEYRPSRPGTPLGQQVAAASYELMNDPRCEQSILVFLPGAKEISEAEQYCRRLLHSENIDVLPLMADLPTTKQRLAFDKSRRRLILATNVAETSITIPGITGVIDSGLAKIAGHAHWSGMPTLQVKEVSKASIVQRAGRAGRVQAGVVYRLFDESSYLAREPFTVPEIKRVDLSSSVLQMFALQGRLWHEREQLPWYEQPDEKLWNNACNLLSNLGMIDQAGKVTEWGRRASAVPLHPRHAAVYLSAIDSGQPEVACYLSALLSEGFLLRNLGGSLERRHCDVQYQLEILKDCLDNSRQSGGFANRSIDDRRIGSLKRLAQMLANQINMKLGRLERLPKHNEVSTWLLRGYPDRVAKLQMQSKRNSKRPTRPRYHFCLGRGGLISEQSVLTGTEEFIIAIDAQENLKQVNAAKSTIIRSASGVNADILLTDPSGVLLNRRKENRVHPQSGAVELFQVTFYGELVVAEERLPDSGDSSQILERMLQQWPWPYPDQHDLLRHNAKANLLRNMNWDAQLTHFSGELLELFIHSLADGKVSGDEVLSLPLGQALQMQLSYQELELLRTVIPDKIRLMNGKVMDLEYDENGCAMHGYIQDFFGVSESPSLLDGRCPIRLFLLAPNKRTAQITLDLKGFWSTSYFEIRRELQRRYPRHYWPDDPVASKPYLTKRMAENNYFE